MTRQREPAIHLMLIVPKLDRLVVPRVALNHSEARTHEVSETDARRDCRVDGIW
jgi:hypothetical protein